ncbi:hypothetical protein [Asaia sp. HN010]|uniref:hypothetical protein n=1 Tax=Asaia sp. HN010 TaxID=3081233 RepID=UPI003019776B
MIKFYVFEKNGVLLALSYNEPFYSPYRSPQYFDDLAQFDYVTSQGFFYYDADFHGKPEPIFAYNADGALLIAAEIKSREINRLLSDIEQLKSNKGFSLTKSDAYQVFGYPDGTPSKEIEPVRRKLLKYFHPDNGEVKSIFMAKIINIAWDSIKK